MSKTELYTLLAKQTRALLEARVGWLSNAANLSALLYHSLPEINWTGFYLLDGTILRLGPFQGQVACTEIPLGKGVCGTAALSQQTQVVADVHQFKGHITCDSASQSEIVIPVIRHGHVWGVLDIDSPVLNRFDPADRAGLEEIVRIFASVSKI